MQLKNIKIWNLHAKLPWNLKNELLTLGKKRLLNISDIVREALSMWIKKEKSDQEEKKI